MSKFQCYVLYVDDPLSIEYADECVASAQQFGFAVVRFQGFYNQTDEIHMAEATGVGQLNHNGEGCCSASHVMIWKEIAKLDHPAVIMEHDAIVKRDFSNVEIKDGELVFLGTKIFHKDDYEFPDGWEIENVPVTHFEGTHAYAITPVTAQQMLDKLYRLGTIPTTVDGILGLGNRFQLRLFCVDPPCIVAATGNKQSFACGGKSAWYNKKAFPGFKAGLKVPFDEELQSSKGRR